MAEEVWRISKEHDKKGKFCPLALDPDRVRELTSPADLRTLTEDRGCVVYPQFKAAVELPADPAEANEQNPHELPAAEDDSRLKIGRSLWTASGTMGKTSSRI